ncbi:MAG: cyclase family protein [Candidatus Synoicihabitans palmerolidicus]|nr:cyclase family protein [Candidatus Synoicihabitans palmerolidicus]
MRLIDVSQTLEHNSPGAPFYPRPRFKLPRNKAATEGWNAEMLTLPSHCGTHLDMPNHKLAQWKSSSEFPLEVFVGSAHVLYFRDAAPRTQITASMLKEKLPNLARNRIVLIATGWAQKRGHNDVWYYDVPYLTPDAAGFLADHHITGVGIDHWTIGGSEDPLMSLTHTILMAGNCWIVENLKFGLDAFDLPQPVEFWALPIKLSKQVSGCFCRAVIRIP